jgi:hypothetical protein
MDQQHKNQPKQGNQDGNKNKDDNKNKMDKDMPDKSKTGKPGDPHKTAKHPGASGSSEDEPVGDDNPNRSIPTGDDPEETKKKIPNMHK